MKSAMLLTSGDGLGDESYPKAPRTMLWTIVWRRRWTFLTLLMLCTGAAAVKTLLTTPLYRSEARIFVRKGSLELTGDQAGTHGASIANQCRVITSGRILARAVAAAQEKAPKTLAGPDAMAKAFAGLAASPGNGEELISLSFDGPDAAEAAIVLQAVVDAYQEYHVERKALVRENWDRDQKSLVAQRKALTESLGVIGAGNSTGSGSTGVANATSHEDLSSLGQSLNAARMEALNAQSELENVKAIGSDAGKMGAYLESMRLAGQIPAGDAGARQQLDLARQRLRELRANYMEEHPAVKAAKANVTALEGAIAEADRATAARLLDMLGQRAQFTGQRLAKLSEQYLAAQKSVAAAERTAAQVAQVEADLRRTDMQLDALANRIQGANLDAQTAGGTVEVVEMPSINVEAISPHRLRDLMLGVCAGMTLGVAGAVVRDATDRRVRDAAELSVATRLPVLGAMPRIRGRISAHEMGKKIELESISDFAEACRSIRTALFFAASDVPPRTILVTSPMAGEGKSTLASNLAIAIARAGRKVLLLDADLRRPMQHEIFQAIPRADLARLQAGEQSVESAIQSSEVENLSLMLCGKTPANPSELLNNARFLTLLEDLSLRYDHIVVDSPPVGVASDARILSAYCSVTLMVVRSGRSLQAAVSRAQNALVSVGGVVLGLVLNHSTRREDHYGSYGYYGSNNGQSGGNAGAGGGMRLIVPQRGAVESTSLSLNKATLGGDEADAQSFPA